MSIVIGANGIAKGERATTTPAVCSISPVACVNLPNFSTESWATLDSSAYAWVSLFQAGRFDTASSLYNFRLRNASPTQGRWVQVDPLQYGAGDTNLYRTLFNSPTQYTDPSGAARVFHQHLSCFSK
jgi:RHS repeat-associated protein